MSMKITAIIDSYNSRKYLEEAIKSVLNQNRRPDEFLIVDDASTDGSADFAEELIEGVPWARVIRKPNGGQLSCLSRGVIESSGDILAFLDGDDYWLAHHLQAAEKQFKANKKLSMYFSACTACGESERAEEYMYRSYSPGPIGMTQVVTACGGSYVGGLNSTLVVSAESVKPYLPLPREIERDWVVNADNIMIWLTSLHGGEKYAEVKPGICYRFHAQNNSKKLSTYPAKIHRKAAKERFFEYCRRVFFIPDDFARLLPHEYRAHPVKTKKFRRQYLKALQKSSHHLSFSKALVVKLRIYLAR